jgi:hypothetical protein
VSFGVLGIDYADDNSQVKLKIGSTKSFMILFENSI